MTGVVEIINLPVVFSAKIHLKFKRKTMFFFERRVPLLL